MAGHDGNQSGCKCLTAPASTTTVRASSRLPWFQLTAIDPDDRCGSNDLTQIGEDETARHDADKGRDQVGAHRYRGKGGREIDQPEREQRHQAREQAGN